MPLPSLSARSLARPVTPLVSFVLLATTACKPFFSYVPLSGSHRRVNARPTAMVDLYVLNPPPRPFESVGLLELREGMDDHSINELIALLRERAGVFGCEGLYVTTIHPVSTRHQPVTVQGVCMAYTSPAPSK